MTASARRTLGMKALVVDDELTEQSAAGRAVRGLVAELERRDVEVVTATAADDAIAIIRSDPALQCILLDWDLGPEGHDLSASVVEAVRQRNATIPVFLLADRSVASTVPASIMSKVSDFVWMLEDTVDFVGGRIEAAILRYRGTVLPPMFAALAKFATVHEFSWHTPGHTGEPAFSSRHPGAPSSSSSAKGSCAPTFRSRWASSARFSIIQAPSAPARNTPRAYSARIAAITSPTAHRPRTG